MGMIRWLLGGLVGGVTGGLIWVLIGYFTEYEVGWIAWGVGFLVGLGVRLAAQDEGMGQGIVAALVAVGSVLAAKFILFGIWSGGTDVDEFRQAINEMRNDDEMLILRIADEVANEMTSRGETIHWPAGMNVEEASSKEDYPSEIWQRAETRWHELGPEAQHSRRDELLSMIDLLSDAAEGPGFTEVFSPWDLLWFALAGITAFRLAAGTFDTD